MGFAVFKGEEVNGKREKGSDPNDWKYSSWIVVVCCSHDIADTLIVGQFLGAKALAAVGSAYTLMVFLTSVLLGLCMGSGAIFHCNTGQETGKR